MSKELRDACDRFGSASIGGVSGATAYELAQAILKEAKRSEPAAEVPMDAAAISGDCQQATDLEFSNDGVNWFRPHQMVSASLLASYRHVRGIIKVPGMTMIPTAELQQLRSEHARLSAEMEETKKQVGTALRRAWKQLNDATNSVRAAYHRSEKV